MDGKSDIILILGFWSLYSPMVITSWYTSEQSFNLGITLFTGILLMGLYVGIRYLLFTLRRGKKEVSKPQNKEEEKPQEILDASLEDPFPNTQKEVPHYDLN